MIRGVICSVVDGGDKNNFLNPEILGPPTLATGIVIPISSADGTIPRSLREGTAGVARGTNDQY